VVAQPLDMAEWRYDSGMADEQMQPTQPKGKGKDGKPHKPVEIPVPLERDVMDLLEKAAHASSAGEKHSGDDG
jgi:hypothetical protein